MVKCAINKQNILTFDLRFRFYPKNVLSKVKSHTANMCREITVKVHLKNCNFEKLQFFTVDHSSLCFLPVKNCNFSIIFNVVYFALN